MYRTGSGKQFIFAILGLILAASAGMGFGLASHYPLAPKQTQTAALQNQPRN